MSSPDYAAARRKRLHQVIIFLLCLATLLVYSNSFRSGFPQDNQKMILLDSRITAVTVPNLALIFTRGYWYPIETSGLYRPLTTLSYLINYAVLGNGARPAGYHLVNLLLQWLNVALVYLLAWELFGDFGLAVTTAAIWALHPLLTESVTNTIGRADLLAGAAVLGGLLLHIRATSARSAGLLAVLATIGIFSKENAVVLPALMAAYDVTFRRKHRGFRIEAYAAVLAPFLFCWWVRWRVLEPAAHPFVDNPLLGAGFWTAKFTILKVVGKCLWLLVFPLRLSSDYSYNQIPLVRAWDGEAAAAGAASVLMLCTAVVCFRRRKAVFFFLIFSATTFLPSSNLVVPIGSIMAERFLYLPAIGFAACAASALAAAGRRFGKPWFAPAAVALLCLAFGARTFARNADWRNDETLSRSAVAAAPSSFKTHMALAMALSAKDPPQIDAAVREMARSLEILSSLPDERKVAIAYSRAGELYRKQGELGKARDVLLRGAAVDRLANQQHRQQWMRRGIPASRIQRVGITDIYLQLGLTYLSLHEPRRALEAFQYGRTLSPYNAEFYGGMANAYGAMGDRRQQAVALLEGATVLPAEARFPALLSAAYARLDTGGCRAAAIEPANGRVHLNLNCPLVQEHVCAAREDLVRLFLEVKLPRVAERLRQQALTELRCPLRQFDVTIPEEP